MIKIKKKKLNILFKNKKIFLFGIFIFCLFNYYIFLFLIGGKNRIIENEFRKNQIKIKEDILKKDTITKIPDDILKNNQIKNIQEEIKKIFNNQIKKKPSFKLSPHFFQKGDILYAFDLSTKLDDKLFQECIVSEKYDIDDTKYLPVSIKGKNNKIFFNQKGDFVGISAPNQNNDSEINYVITSNIMFYHSQCEKQVIKYNEKDEIDYDSDNKYYFSVETKTNKDNKIYKYKCFLDQNGLFVGIQEKEKKITNIEDFLIYLTESFEFLKESCECQEKLKSEEKNKKKIKEKEDKKNFFDDLEKITFLIELKNEDTYGSFISLGSGFIFDVVVKQENKKNKYKYYILTNRHVIKKIDTNHNIEIILFNSFFQEQNGELFGSIDNENIYDDVAILSFEDDNLTRFQEIKAILSKTFPKEKVNFYQGEVIYSMGSQVEKMPPIKIGFKENSNRKNIQNNNNEISEIKLNLLKKGNIVSYHEREISFDIKIDSGNSGGPVFNTKGEIIGLNKSTICLEGSIPDDTSQCINIQHVFKIRDKIFKLKEKRPDDIFFKKISEEDFDFVEKEFNSFLPFSKNKNLSKEKYKDNINFSIQELSNYFQKEKKKFIKSNLISEKEKKFNIKWIFPLPIQEKIFSIEHDKEQIEIQYDLKKEIIIFKKYNNNNLKDTKKYYINEFDPNFKPFLSLKLINNIQNTKNINENEENIKLKNNLKKIKNSLIIWERNKKKGGNGIIFQKIKKPNNIFLYSVLSTCDINKNKFEHLTEPIQNFFNDDIEITTFYNYNYKKERGKIKSYFFEKHNLVLINFESSHDYDIVPNRPIEDLLLGEELFFVINIDNDDYVPQVFKSVISSKHENYILCDSIFNLKNKNEIGHSKFNFLYFDHEANLVGINDVFIKDDIKIPEHFIKVSLFKEKDIENLILQGKFKDNFNLFFSCFFIITILLIIIKNSQRKKI
ncbi:MAG: serine protease [Candidatus Phytoplasma stylosanthis]|nr:serine protease [Candidatus Phytoplasma stylosanthis]